MSQRSIAQAAKASPPPEMMAHSNAPSRFLQRKCACGQHTMEGQCDSCKKNGQVQRKSSGDARVNTAPPIVHRVLESSGRPLDGSTRKYFEPRFGHDFSRVRVHSDSLAEESASAVHAKAYTVGSHLVLGKNSATSKGGRQSLLAHELTHVVQQRNSRYDDDSRSIEIRPPTDAAEKEADRNAENIEHATAANRHPMATAFGLQRLMCDSILNAEEGERVSGNEAERQIRSDFIMQSGNKFARFPIPGGSSKAIRTECGGSEGSIDPQVTGGRSGLGTPDLALISGRRLELAEVKIGTWQCLHFAEDQVRNYVEKGNSEENAAWRRSHGIDGFDLMSTSRFTPHDFTVDQKTVSVGWCEPGVVVYKPAQKSNEETFLCGAISDKGAIDRFLDKAMDPAQKAVDQYLDATISPMIDEYITKELAARHLDIATELVLRLISQIKANLMARLRQAMKAELRQYLQNALAALCAKAAAKAAISIKDLLKQLQKDMGPLILVPALVEASRQLAAESAAVVLDVAKKIALAIIIAVATAVTYFFLRGFTGAPEGEPGFEFAPPMEARATDPTSKKQGSTGNSNLTPQVTA